MKTTQVTLGLMNLFSLVHVIYLQYYHALVRGRWFKTVIICYISSLSTVIVTKLLSFQKEI